MKNRLHFAIVGGLLVVGIILGSIFDLQINQALFSNRNAFGIGVSMFGMIPGYAFLSFFGGTFFYLIYKGEFPKPWKIVLCLLSFVALGAAAWFTSKEFFSVNGANLPGIGYTILALAISVVIHGGIYVLGLFLGKRINGKYAWVGILILMLAVLVALVPGVTLFKNILHRPRYRTIQLGIDGIAFHNWWEPFPEYQNFISSVPKEEFKSFPSGHSACAMVVSMLLMWLPLVNDKLVKHQTLLFYLGVGYAAFVAFTRMLVGAHFLTDVCFGMLITLICSFAGNEIIVRKKLFELDIIHEQP